MDAKTDLELLGTNDAMAWAEAFVEHKARNKWTLDQIDDGLMLTWFANAMAAQEFSEKRKERLSASEALFGFCAWLTTRKEVVSMSSSRDCVPIIELISLFKETNKLEDPRDGWEKYLQHPEEKGGAVNNDPPTPNNPSNDR